MPSSGSRQAMAEKTGHHQDHVNKECLYTQAVNWLLFGKPDCNGRPSTHVSVHCDFYQTKLSKLSLSRPAGTSTYVTDMLSK